MGVAGLWKVSVLDDEVAPVSISLRIFESSQVLEPARAKRSLTHMAVVDGFEGNPGGMRGLRVGIDASIWIVHATHWVQASKDGSDKGENPEIRTIMFKLITLMEQPFLPLFVFDGPLRPAVKRGKQITKTHHWMVAATQDLLTALGVEWRTVRATVP